MIVLVRTKVTASIVALGGVLLGIGASLIGAGFITVSLTSLGTASSLARAGVWLTFAGFAMVLAGVCAAGWRIIPESQWVLLGEAGAGAIAMLLLSISALLTASGTGHPTSIGVLAGFGFGVWAGVCLYRAARSSMAEGAGTSTSPRASSLWGIAAGALVLVAIAEGLPQPVFNDNTAGIAAGVMAAVGVALLAGVVVAARNRRWFTSRALNLLIAGLAVMCVHQIIAAVAAGVAYNPSGSLTTFKVMLSLDEFSAALAWFMLAGAAWQRFTELQWAGAAGSVAGVAPAGVYPPHDPVSGQAAPGAPVPQPSWTGVPGAQAVPTPAAPWSQSGYGEAAQYPPQPTAPPRGPGPITRFVKSRTRRFWVLSGVIAVVIIAAAIALPLLSSANAANHAPSKAAINYLNAYSTKNVPMMLANGEVTSMSNAGVGTSVQLTSTADITKELATPKNEQLPVSDVKVMATHATGDSASVTLQYVLGGNVQEQTYSLVKSSNAVGWAVQISPVTYKVTVPANGGALTIAGIPVHVQGTSIEVTQFPSWVTIKMAGTTVYAPQSLQEDRSSATGGSTAPVTVPAELTADAAKDAKGAVGGLLVSCLKATTFSPPNCPNSIKVPYECTPTAFSHPSCTQIQWIGAPGWGTSVKASVDRTTGAVEVTGTLKATVKYQVTTTTPLTNKPTTRSSSTTTGFTPFRYPVTMSGGQWKVGTLATGTGTS
jgi:hypothetical protein